MSVRSTITAMQAVHAGITGVKRAPVKLPGPLQQADLPTVICWPGPTPRLDGWTASAGPGWYHHKREYLVRVYVAAWAEGVGYDQAHQECITLLQSFGEAYMTFDASNLSGAVAHVGPPITDSGVVRLMYLDDSFHGFEFRVTVTEKAGV